ncbi:MAG: substrate-binding domain-containing protein [Alphaproteobacteria bacterium]
MASDKVNRRLSAIVSADRKKMERMALPVRHLVWLRQNRIVGILLCAVFSAASEGPARAAEIKVLSGGAMEPVMRELVPLFQRSTHNSVAVSYAPTAPVIKRRIRNGEAADIAIATKKGIADLVKQGRISKVHTIDIARVSVGVFVRNGAFKPDISSMAAFKKALLSAKAIAHSDPARGGRTARYVSKLLAELDIAPMIRSKIKIFAPGGFGKVLKDGEIGFALTTEIKARPGVELVGVLPPEIRSHTDFAAGVLTGSGVHDAARKLMRFFASRSARRILVAKGFDPL